MKLKRMGRLVERLVVLPYYQGSSIRRGWGGTGDGMVPSLILLKICLEGHYFRDHMS